MVGSPDWILEIVSKGSVRKGTNRLRGQYYRADVSEYWLIDAWGEEIDFQILVRGETDFVPSEGTGGWQWSPLFQRYFRLTWRRNRLGRWEVRFAGQEEALIEQRTNIGRGNASTSESPGRGGESP